MDIIQRGFASTINGMKLESGDWKVLVSMTESRTVNGEAPEDVVLETSCTDMSFEAAYQTAMTATLAKFELAIADGRSGSLFPSEEDLPTSSSNVVSAEDLLKEE